MLTLGIWANALHNEIWVFDQGFWRKDAALYTEIQKADWDDVILDSDFKKTFQKDVYGFFESEDLYKKLAIPWKVCDCTMI
jgi:transitional endoplasmic reticulum ATPase